MSTSSLPDEPVEASPASATAGTARQDGTGRTLLHAVGVSAHVGLNGVGADIALPVARHFNLRVGGQYVQYTGHFTEEGANIDVAAHLGNGKVAVDYFPFHNGFHISPHMFFALQTGLDANVLIPGGSTVVLDGNNYISSPTDPLHGTGRVATRSWAPGLTIGYGNIAPRGDKHWSFPVEVGFYYIGQPSLSVTFDGSACDPYATPAECEKVTTDPGFQSDLQNFIKRNNNNLSYASFFPVAQFGVGYRF